MKNVRRFLVAPLLIAVVALAGAATAKRVDYATPSSQYIPAGAAGNVKAAQRQAQKPKKSQRSIEDDDQNRDLDKLEARIHRLFIKVENLETKLLKKIKTTKEPENA